MKISYSLPVLATLSLVVKACDFDMPLIMLSVQFAGGGVLEPPQSTEFAVPLFSDCIYENPAAPIPAGGSIPSTAVAANFPGDSFGFTGSNGLSLEPGALNNFLQALGDGEGMDVDQALSLVVCTVTGSDGTVFQFDDTNTFVFESGAAIDVVSYQCEIMKGS